MRYRKWRVKSFNGYKWYNYRYFMDDLEAFKEFMLRLIKSKEAHQMNIQVKECGAFFNPGGNDNLLWISAGKTARPFGESRDYWKNILKVAKEYAKSINEHKKRSS